jgi:hypothetical protein
MAQQSSGEFASANPTKREEDARVQERGIRAKISLNPRSHLEHLQRPTPSDISKNAPSLQGIGHAGVARSRRRGVIVAPDSDDAAPDFQQRDNPPAISTRPISHSGNRVQISVDLNHSADFRVMGLIGRRRLPTGCDVRMHHGHSWLCAEAATHLLCAC